MAYGIMKYCISQDRMPGLSAYLDGQTRMAKLLRAIQLFRCFSVTIMWYRNPMY